ncbi:MAG TPA: hypothetical protein EYP18_03925 [Desulfobacterales bacterium]|nr:hypothetical protein [Desulfobacterales bacterium]
MNKKCIVGSALILLFGSQSAMAESGDVGIGAKAGTLGAGVEIMLGISDDLALRGGFNYIKFDFDSTLIDVDYTMEPEFKNLTMLLDWHPFSGAFRLTGGFSLNDNKVNLDGTVSRSLVPSEYGQFSYLTDLVRVQGSVDFNSFAPYAGLGWTSAYGESGWGVSCDFGVLFQGAAKVSDLNVVTGVDYGLFQGEVEAFLDEQEKEIQDELDKYEYYPVASIMVHYKF